MNIKILFIVAACVTINLACDTPPQFEKDMLAMNKIQGMDNLTPEHYKQRKLASQGTPRPLKIFFDLTSLESGLQQSGLGEHIDLWRRVFEITGEWWGGALTVSDNQAQVTSSMQSFINRFGNDPRYEKYLNFQFGNADIEDFDLFIRVHLEDAQRGVLAFAGPFIRHPQSQRPISGSVSLTPFGNEFFVRSADTVNRAAETMIHEFGHVIAFISFNQFQNDKLEFNQQLNSFVFTGNEVLEKARRHYGCQNLTGVPLQTNINNGQASVGGHWSEPFLRDEAMTPSTSGSSPTADMTLALCEDTTWYKADYRFSENFTAGQNQGCGFFNNALGTDNRAQKKQVAKKRATMINTKHLAKQNGLENCPQPLICNPNDRRSFVTSDRKGLGFCTTDEATGCPIERKFTNRDCDNEAGWRDDYVEFGATYAGDCVVARGLFNRVEGRFLFRAYTVSVQADCAADNSSYTLTFKNFDQNAQFERVGDAVINCTSRQVIKFNEATQFIPSYVRCEDPQTFCEARFPEGNVNNDDAGDNDAGDGNDAGAGDNDAGAGDNDSNSSDNDSGDNNGAGNGNENDDGAGVPPGGDDAATIIAQCDRTCRKNGRCQNIGKNETRIRKKAFGKYAHTSFAHSTQVQNNFRCWCYDDFLRTKGSCPNLPEDDDGRGRI